MIIKYVVPMMAILTCFGCAVRRFSGVYSFDGGYSSVYPELIRDAVQEKYGETLKLNFSVDDIPGMKTGEKYTLNGFKVMATPSAQEEGKPSGAQEPFMICQVNELPDTLSGDERVTSFSVDDCAFSDQKAAVSWIDLSPFKVSFRDRFSKPSKKGYRKFDCPKDKAIEPENQEICAVKNALPLRFSVVSRGLENVSDKTKALIRRHAEEKKAILSDLKTLLAKSPASYDYINFELVKRIVKQAPSLSFLVGNGHADVLKADAEKISTILQAVQMSSAIVVYDADAASAPLIESQLPDNFRLGISAVVQKPGVVKISSPHLRRLAFASADAIVSSMDSLIGFAVSLESKIIFVSDLGNHSIKDAGYAPDKIKGRWVSSIDKSKGLGAATAPSAVVLSVAEVVESLSERKPVPNPVTVQTDKPDWYEALSGPVLKAIFDDVNVFSRGSEFFKKSVGGQSLVGGAAIFGSSQSKDWFKDDVIGLAEALAMAGIPVTTGGAGGVMELANFGAYRAGGESIGIPLGGAAKLATEPTSMDALHTMTIPTTGFDTRIPLLLWDKQIVVMAPGGGGSVKELASTLMMLSFKSADGPVLAFLNSESYYSELYAGIAHSFPFLVQDTDSHLALVGSSGDINTLVSQALARSQRLKSYSDNVKPLLKTREAKLAPVFKAGGFAPVFGDDFGYEF